MKNIYKILIANTLIMGAFTVYANGMSFATFDADKSGTVSEQEFNDARNKRIEERAKEGRQMKGLANMASFADMDSNADKKISADEFASFLAEHKKKAH